MRCASPLRLMLANFAEKNEALRLENTSLWSESLKNGIYITWSDPVT